MMRGEFREKMRNYAGVSIILITGSLWIAIFRSSLPTGAGLHTRLETEGRGRARIAVMAASFLLRDAVCSALVVRGLCISRIDAEHNEQ
jgi:hypothetical protein